MIKITNRDNSVTEFKDFNDFTSNYYPIYQIQKKEIVSVYFSEDVVFTDASNLFSGFVNLEKFIFHEDNFKKCTSFFKMFSFCRSLNHDLNFKIIGDPEFSLMLFEASSFDSKIFIKRESGINELKEESLLSTKQSKETDNSLSLNYKFQNALNGTNLSRKNLIHNYKELGIVEDYFYKERMKELNKKDLYDKI